MKAIESYWKDTAAVWENTKDGLSVLAISDFPSSNHAKLYSTKRKSVKNALDSSLKLISYSSIFASIFLVEVGLAILTVMNPKHFLRSFV